MDVRTIVVADNETLRDLYQKQVTAFGIACDAVTNFHELYRSLQETPYNGLLIDLPTSIRADNTEKVLLHEVQQFYPVLRMKWDDQHQQLRCQLYGSIAGTSMTIRSFIEQHCRPFPARQVRKEKRQQIHLNTLISRDDSFAPQELERSVTLDVSPGGCLLLTTREWQTGTRIWLRILELQDQTPIEAEIRHWTCWGTPRKLPSIGVEFIALTESQQAQLEKPLAISRTKT